jgi:hypothetical protein
MKGSPNSVKYEISELFWHPLARISDSERDVFWVVGNLYMCIAKQSVAL